MVLWLLLVSLVAFAVLTTSVRRYSSSHVAVQFASAGCTWPDRGWRVVAAAAALCRRVCEDRGRWGDPPPDTGVREPRRPEGPGPRAGWVELVPPRS
jgi:hypothetical protein